MSDTIVKQALITLPGRKLMICQMEDGCTVLEAQFEDGKIDGIRLTARTLHIVLSALAQMDEEPDFTQLTYEETEP